MKRVLFFATALLSVQVFAQCEGRYESEIFSSVSVIEVEYTDVYDWGPFSSGLHMDVYTPNGDSYTERPLIIFAHGGSFWSGNKNNPMMVALCESFAKRGYVTASIQYRLTSIWNLTDSMHMLQTVMNGISDAKAAIRYFRKDAAVNGNVFGIDPDQIYVGGYSAGAILAVNLAYINDTVGVPSHLLPIIDATGGLEGNSGNPGYSSEVKAVVNVAGAVYKSSYIDANDAPIVSIHALDDGTVPYFCDHAMSNPLILKVCGSGTIHNAVDFSGIYNALHIFPSGDHSIPFSEVNNITIPFVSDFLYTTLDCYEGTNIKESQLELEVYPNPARDVLNVVISDQVLGVQILNMLGERFTFTVMDGKIDISDLASGFYCLELKTRDTTILTKFVKQ
tara:strand:+ start:2997 stop:4175 length:1179 start_codon:yes stop_codon:yes gene_type:complete